MRKLEIKPCKVCGNMPTLRRQIIKPQDYNYLMKYEEPQPFYECDFCKMTEEVRKQNIIIEDWNNKQK